MSEQGDALNRMAREAGLPVKVLRLVEQGGGAGDDGVVELPAVEISQVISKMAAEVGRVLCGNGIFIRNRSVHTIDGKGRLEDMDALRFRTYCDDHMLVFRWKQPQPNEFVKDQMTMNKETAATILRSDQFLKLQREVVRVSMVRQPILRKDGRMELLPFGYDEESKIYTQNSGVSFAEDMGMDEARVVVRDILGEFPWGDRTADGQSRNEAVIVSGMVSMFAATLQAATARRMNFMVSSNSEGSGKTLVAQVCIIPTFGACDVQPLPETEENMRKILDTETLAAAPYIVFDDINGFFKSGILNSFLTAPTWSGRLMQTQSKFTAPKMAPVFLTGNNLEVTPDIARRFLHCKMNVDEADPQDRGIRREIDDAFLTRPEIRGRVLAAVWAFVREWDGAGRPASQRVIRGYEEWSRIFGGIVYHAGFGDPLEPLAVEESGNSKRADMQALVAALAALLFDEDAGEQEFSFQTIVDICVKLDAFSWMMDGTENKEGEMKLKPAKCSMFGKMLSEEFGGKKFRLHDGRRVQFGHRGKNRSKKYLVKVIA